MLTCFFILCLTLFAMLVAGQIFDLRVENLNQVTGQHQIKNPKSEIKTMKSAAAPGNSAYYS